MDGQISSKIANALDELSVISRPTRSLDHTETRPDAVQDGGGLTKWKRVVRLKSTCLPVLDLLLCYSADRCGPIFKHTSKVKVNWPPLPLAHHVLVFSVPGSANIKVCQRPEVTFLTLWLWLLTFQLLKHTAAWCNHGEPLCQVSWPARC